MFEVEGRIEATTCACWVWPVVSTRVARRCPRGNGRRGYCGGDPINDGGGEGDREVEGIGDYGER